MSLTPGRAPIRDDDEPYAPLRMPHSLRKELSPHAQEFVPKTNNGSSTSNTSGYKNPEQNFNQNFQQQFQNLKHLNGFQQNNQQYQRTNQQQSYNQQPQRQQYRQHHQQHQQHQHQLQQQQIHFQQQIAQQNYNIQHHNEPLSILPSAVQNRLNIKAKNDDNTSLGGNVMRNTNFHQQMNQQQHQQHQQYQQHHQQQQHQHQQHHHQQQHQHQQQQQHRSTQLQQRLQNKQHQNNTQSQSHRNKASNSSYTQQDETDLQNSALNFLQKAIVCLKQNPGDFDKIATGFHNFFDGMENNQYVLSIAMEDIFQESIQNSNFRYMGAKMYNLLYMLNLHEESLFHVLLKCKLDYHKEEIQNYMEQNQDDKVRETALFLAELYMQLRGEDKRIHLIAQNIIYTLKQLLKKETTDNVRCVCLTLKLAGYDLTADCASEVQYIILKLEEINMNSPGKYPLAVNVISLQKDNWGRKQSNSLNDLEALKAPEPLRLSDEPIFYGPDGRELTAEETEFLSGGVIDINCSIDDDDDDDEEIEPECELADPADDIDDVMDDEVQAAYEEFCKMNQKRT